MKFKGNGSVWDAESNSGLVTFVNGVFETNDEAIIKKLKDSGFIEEDEVLTETNSEDEAEVSKSFEEFETLRELAKESGIADYEMKTADELKELLEKE